MDAETSLSPARFAEASELLVRAFFDNPAHVYISPDVATRERRLRWLLSRNLRVQSDVGRSFCICESPGAGSSRLVAMGFWHSPGAQPVGKAKLLRHGLALAPLRLGVSGLQRMLETTEVR